MAGVYPAPLCRRWAALVASAASSAGPSAQAAPSSPDAISADVRQWEARLCATRGAGEVCGFVPKCPGGAPPEWDPGAK
eukprot:16439239-Heterocapsa_arctica.AAC.1